MLPRRKTMWPAWPHAGALRGAGRQASGRLLGGCGLLERGERGARGRSHGTLRRHHQGVEAEEGAAGTGRAARSHAEELGRQGANGEEVEDEARSEEHTSELQSRGHLVCRLLLEKKK